MLVLITYDVNTETAAGKGRLRKVAKQCVNYGRRVQNSVFECILDHAQCVLLKSILTDIIDESVDSYVFIIWETTIRRKLNILVWIGELQRMKLLYYNNYGASRKWT